MLDEISNCSSEMTVLSTQKHCKETKLLDSLPVQPSKVRALSYGPLDLQRAHWKFHLHTLIDLEPTNFGRRGNLRVQSEFFDNLLHQELASRIKEVAYYRYL